MRKLSGTSFPRLKKGPQHRFPLGIVKNPDVPFENLPAEAEVIDPATGRPKKGIRYRVAKRSNSTPACPEGALHEIVKVNF